jgi:exosome complex component RRP40
MGGSTILPDERDMTADNNLIEQYVPRVGELVIGTVHHSTGESFFVHLTDYTSPALLPHLAFESVTKKTRPQLPPGSLVYARVSLADKHMDPELECVSSATGKADGLGPLNGGMLYHISLGMARRLMLAHTASVGKVVVLDELAAAGLQFDTATGRNGRFWVSSEQPKTVIAVGRAIQDTDQKNLTVDEQKKLVRKLIKEMS